MEILHFFLYLFELNKYDFSGTLLCVRVSRSYHLDRAVGTRSNTGRNTADKVPFKRIWGTVRTYKYCIRPPSVGLLNYDFHGMAYADFDRCCQSGSSQFIDGTLGKGLSPLRSKPGFKDRLIFL